MLKSKMNPRVFWGASLIIGALLAVALGRGMARISSGRRG